MVLQCVVVSGAVVYNVDSRYTVDLPEGFRQVGENEFVADDESEFSVSFEDNTEEQLCIADMSDKDINTYIEDMKATGNAAFEEYAVNGSVEILSAEKIKHSNGQYALDIRLQSQYTSDGETIVRYHKILGFSCVENKITFVYTVADEDDLNNLDGAFDSIVINEKKVESKLDKITTVAFYAGIFVVMVLVVILFVKRRIK